MRIYCHLDAVSGDLGEVALTCRRSYTLVHDHYFLGLKLGLLMNTRGGDAMETVLSGATAVIRHTSHGPRTMVDLNKRPLVNFVRIIETWMHGETAYNINTGATRRSRYASPHGVELKRVLDLLYDAHFGNSLQRVPQIQTQAPQQPPTDT